MTHPQPVSAATAARLFASDTTEPQVWSTGRIWTSDRERWNRLMTTGIPTAGAWDPKKRHGWVDCGTQALAERAVAEVG